MFTSPYDRSRVQELHTVSQNGSTTGSAPARRPHFESRDYFPVSGYQAVGQSNQSNNNEHNQHATLQGQYPHQIDEYDYEGPPGNHQRAAEDQNQFHTPAVGGSMANQLHYSFTEDPTWQQRALSQQMSRPQQFQRQENLDDPYLMNIYQREQQAQRHQYDAYRYQGPSRKCGKRSG